MTTITLPWATPPLTQNIVRRLHYQTEARMKRTMLAEAYAAIRRAHVTPMGAAIITLHYQPGTRRLWDCDGLAVTHKVVQDALVKAGVIEKDDWRYVPEIRIKAHPPAVSVPARMWVTLVPVEGDA